MEGEGGGRDLCLFYSSSIIAVTIRRDVTNRVHLPWKGRERARTTQISDALSLTTLLRRAALRPQPADKSLRQASQAVVSTCRLQVDLLEANALQRSHTERVRTCSNGVALPRCTHGRCQ